MKTPTVSALGPDTGRAHRAYLADSEAVDLLSDPVPQQRPLTGRGARPPPCSEAGAAMFKENNQSYIICRETG